MDTVAATPQTQPEQRKPLYQRFPVLTIESGPVQWSVSIGYSTIQPPVALQTGGLTAILAPDVAREIARALYAAADAIDAERAETTLGFTS
ncbi:hypothetical protein C3942_16825 [Solimonas fluminis]|uniref:Uncharacterized protein n=1 Tax=Solimonas fluminis TaxID=2086571 RepID=A0A2S5TCQ8_9GAMM|nr:hypothetical protein [Solimonas fluminis]PPE72712.1 hypothetical protein C3942_16825 [Solimonas fluminis]